ncbi:uncharacterized protein LOC115787121 [Archocentrus centrarchus]|uniref:uncharacterized protein LOC115787121 n=1 Tax=Archocentrus centrarchus TaxID=63155 RepID=UPI0011E9E422|nr:uncharacterized protein LOC115787121 [Archocentrus centrarchus]
MGSCTNDHNFVTKTADVGNNVTLSCVRQQSPLHQETLYWIRLVSGSWLEFLGGTFTFDYTGVNNTSHITAKQEPGNFVLHINKTKLSDSGFYYCIKVRQLHMMFLEGIFLRIEGTEPDITEIIQIPPSDPIHPGDPVTLQCLVLSNSEKKTCPGDHSVYWFRAKSDKSPLSLMYAHGNSGEECERSPEAPSQRKCVYSFSKNISSSDVGSYYCAVATCGQIIFGNGTKLDIKAPNTWDLQKANTALFLLCAALVTSLVVIASLIYTIKKKTCNCCNDAGILISGDQQSQERCEDSMVYTVPTFRRKDGKVERRREKAAGGETVYSDVSVLTTN